MSTLTETEKHRELARIADRVAKLKSSMAVSLYELGLLLIRVRDGELWKPSFASFPACVEETLGLSRTTAWRAMDISTHFGPEIARRFGSEKLLALHRYLKATAADEQPGDLLAAELQLRGEDGRFRSVSVIDASAIQIEEAARTLELRRAARAEAARARKADRVDRVARLEQRLPAAPAGSVRGKHRVRARQASDGRAVYDFSAVPEEQMADFIAALIAEFGQSKT